MELAPAVLEKGTELLLKQLEELIAQIQIWDRFSTHFRRTARTSTRWDPPAGTVECGGKDDLGIDFDSLGGIAAT